MEWKSTPSTYNHWFYHFCRFFFMEMLKLCDFYFPPTTNIHWIFNFCRFVHWNVNDMWLSLHPINKYSLNFQFLPIFFIEMLKVCDFYFPPPTNIHWIFNFCRFVHWTICDFPSTPSTNAHWIFAYFFVTVCVRYAAGKKVVKRRKNIAE